MTHFSVVNLGITVGEEEALSIVRSFASYF